MTADTGNLNGIDTELREDYRRSLATRVSTLENLRAGLAKGDAEAKGAIRRIAHSLKGSGGSYGFPEITAAARPVEEAADANGKDLDAKLETLLQVLRSVIAGGDATVARAVLLLIDDDRDLLTCLTEVLNAPGREIVTAVSAAASLEVLSRQHVDLIILDLVLPDLDGRNLLVKMRENQATSAVPIIVLSAIENAQAQVECLTLGADVFLAKPINNDVLAASVANQLEKAARVATEAQRDFLTGLPNRASFRDHFSRSCALAERSKKPVAIALFDLDHFKSINDTHGHAAGDEVLRRVGQEVKKTLRVSDFLARWGGEEFIVLFPVTDLPTATTAMNRALASVRELRYAGVGGAEFAVTFSAGLGLVAPGLALEEAVARVDHLLYLAKAAGRNRVVTEADHLVEPRRTILMADDDEHIATILRRHLTEAGFAVTWCSNGEEALKTLAEKEFSAMVLDVDMPQLDGFAVLERLRQEPTTARLPVLMLTSMGDEQDVVRGFELGADDYVIKPFSPVEVAARLRRLLNRK